MIFSIAVSCPFDNGNPCACPFHVIRKKNLEQRMDWIAGMSHESVINLLAFHQACLEEKQAGLFSESA